jgi:hypothetical protein
MRRLFVFWVVVWFLSGCSSLKPIKPELPVLGSDLSVKAPDGQTKLVIYNSSNELMFGTDNTGAIHVAIDGKRVARVNIREYVQIPYRQGKSSITLMHKDIFNFSSSHDLEVKGNTLYVEVYATPISNALVSRNERPADLLLKYRPAVLPK